MRVLHVLDIAPGDLLVVLALSVRFGRQSGFCEKGNAIRVDAVAVPAFPDEDVTLKMQGLSGHWAAKKIEREHVQIHSLEYRTAPQASTATILQKVDLKTDCKGSPIG
jgi:hypothetical protein